MLFSPLSISLSLLSLTTAQYTTSSKRGLVSVHTDNPKDDSLFITPDNTHGLSWYYNYEIQPSTYASIPQSTLEFVPMLWGVSNTTGSSFLSNITSLISKGRNITHVLSFNEPDVNFTSGGSQVSPDLAAASWILNFDPLRKMGIKVAAPCVYANQSGFAWLDKFYKACEKRKSNCTADFANLHFFGDIDATKAYLGTYKQKYPSLPLWITEFALAYSPTLATEEYFNQSLSLFDSDPSIERYSYFGSFRGSASNVGWNVSMLDGIGKLTNIGSWYLGGGWVGDGKAGSGSASATTTGQGAKSTGKTSGVGRVEGGRWIGWGVVGVLGVGMVML